MTEIAFTTSLIAFGLALIGSLSGAACLWLNDFLRSRQEWRANRERWMRLLQ